MSEDQNTKKAECSNTDEREKSLNVPTNDNAAEIYRLAGRPPLLTFLHLIIGPLFSNVTSTLYGIINSIMISRYIDKGTGHTIGLTAVGLETTFEGICRAFGQFLAVAGSTQISSLFGQKKFQDCEQVICDILRVAVICGAIVPAILIPSNKPLCSWFGAEGLEIEYAHAYITPQAACNAMTCIFLSCTGFLQAEGRTTLVGIIDIVCLGCAMVLGGPILMGVLKVGISGPSWATVFADSVPAIGLVTCYFLGVFGVKPKPSGLLKPFSKYSYKGLLIGLSQLVSNLAVYLPGIPMRYFIGSACKRGGISLEDALSGFNTMIRYFTITCCVVLGCCAGYLPAASYAFSAKNYRRYIRLTIHLNWVSFMWCLISGILVLAIPRQISEIFAEGDGYIKYSVSMLGSGNCLNIIMFIRYTMQTTLQAQQRGTRAMILSFVSTFLIVILGEVIFYFAYPSDPVYLMYATPLSIASGVVLGFGLLYGPFMELIRSSRAPKVSEAGGSIYMDEKENQQTKESRSSNGAEENSVNNI